MKIKMSKIKYGSVYFKAKIKSAIIMLLLAGLLVFVILEIQKLL